MTHRSFCRFQLLVSLLVIVSLLAVVELVNVVTAENFRKHLSSKTAGKFYFKPSRAAVESGAGPKIYLSESQELSAIYVGDTGAKNSLESGEAQPLWLFPGDFDAEGVADLAVGYATSRGGALTIHRGNLDAFAPQSKASFDAIGRGEFPSPFLLNAKAIAIPIRPDFMAVGTYHGFGFPDLIVATRGDHFVYLLTNDGKGNFSSPKSFDVGGAISSLAAGDFGKRGAFSKLMVGVCDEGGAGLHVYDGARNQLGDMTSVSLNGPASSFVLGNLGETGPDALFLSDGRLSVLHSASLKLETLPVSTTANAFAQGSFIYDRNGFQQIAILESDGSIDIAAHREFDPHVLTDAEMTARRRAALPKISKLFTRTRSAPTVGWRIVEHIPLALSFSSEQQPVLLRTRISDHGADDLMILDPTTKQLAVVSHPDGHPGDSTFLPAQISTRSYAGAAIAALSTRVNVDGRPGVVALNRDAVAPALMMPLPDPTYFPNRTDDPTPTSPITSACNNTSNTDMSSSCSLREAVLRANANAGTDTIQLAATTYTLTLAKVNGDYTGNHGALYVTDSVNIVGQVDGSGNPTSIIEAGTTAYNAGTPNGVDMVMAVNQDISAFTAATASITNVIFQNGHNRGTVLGTDGDGGCMEFDTGTSGTANLSLTNVVLQNCNTTDGNGGGLASFNTKNSTGLVTISNSIFQNNSAKQVTGGATGTGGGIWLADPSHMSMSSSQVLNNLATNSGGGNAGSGGGITITSNSSNSHQTQIHGSTISGNQTAGLGGGLNITANTVIDQSSVISNNKGGTASVANLQNGGGIYMHPSKNGCPAACTDSVTLTKVTITGNTATGNGGGISNGDISGGTAPTAGPLTMSFSRLAGNTATGSGSNIRNNGTTITATNNWWGTNAVSSTISTINSGTTTFDPFIVLTHTASP